jgi:sugar/nucleoside kinase (ribokinase family)
MKEFQLCGLGNAIVDMFVEVDDQQFTDLGFERGSMRLVEIDEQRQLVKAFQKSEPRLASGGSVANSVIAFSQLGGDGAFIGCLGDDRYGLFYAKEFEELHIEIGQPIIVGEATGTCIVVLTPDAERTMRTCLAVSSHLAAKHVDAERIKKSEWLFIEGYVFANPATGQTAIKEAVRIAKANGVKIAITCSEAFIPQVFGEPLREALQHTDLLFANESEACSITGAANALEAFKRLKDIVPAAVVTDGPRGAHLRYQGTEAHVPSFACEPRDLTGAGDMFAGAYLFGLTHGVAPTVAARGACFLAMKVISQVGARLHHGAKSFWDEAIQ